MSVSRLYSGPYSGKSCRRAVGVSIREDYSPGARVGKDKSLGKTNAGGRGMVGQGQEEEVTGKARGVPFLAYPRLLGV